MSGTKRKIFSAEFKAKVGLEAIQGLKTVNQIAQDHGVHPAQVGQWKKRYSNALAACLKAIVAPSQSMNTVSRIVFTALWQTKNGA